MRLYKAKMILAPSTKNELHELCIQYALEKVATAKNALQDLQESMEEETKNSTGDKYETGRSMIQIEIERITRQLLEAQKLKQTIEFINPKFISNTVGVGTLVQTTVGVYYLSIAIGKVSLSSMDFFVISPTSPVGILMLDKKVGDTIQFNGRSIAIEHII